MKNKNLFESFKNAFYGIGHTIKSERNMKIHVFSTVAILLFSLFFKLSGIEFAIVCITVSLVLICELFNTAVEALVDIIVDGYHPKARIVKDVAAGAVLVAALLSVAVAYIIFFDRVIALIETVAPGIKHWLGGLYGA